MDKLQYLQKQNKQLRAQVEDLKEILQINKTQIDILSNQLKNNPQNTTLIDNILSHRERQDKLQNALMLCKREIAQLETDVKALNIQNFVFRQLNEDQCKEMKNLESLHLAAVELLHKKNKQLEEKVAILQVSYKEYDKVSGFVLKYRDIVTPQEVVLELKNKENCWNDQIQIMKSEVQNAKKNEENLLVINTVLRNKIISLQAQLAMPNRNLGEVLDKSLRKLMLYFIEVQKKITTGEEDSSSDQENDIQLIAPELAGVFPEKKLRLQKDYGVPHLDLLKIRQQMNHATKKINEHLAARNHLSDKQKLERLEIQLEYTRRQLSKNIIDLRGEKQKRKKCQAIANELESRCELLIQSNQNLEVKVRKYWHKLKSQKQKIYGLNTQNQQTGKGLIDDETNHNLEETLLQAHKPKQTKQNDKNKKQQKISLNPSSLLNQYQIDYKIHLQIMAQQLKRNKKLDHLEKLKQTEEQNNQDNDKEQKKMKRSTSNPLLYFNQRRGEIMDVQEEEKQNRLEQTLFMPGKNIGFQDVLEDLDV